MTVDELLNDKDLNPKTRALLVNDSIPMKKPNVYEFHTTKMSRCKICGAAYGLVKKDLCKSCKGKEDRRKMKEKNEVLI
jgi:hypothetical protein